VRRIYGTGEFAVKEQSDTESDERQVRDDTSYRNARDFKPSVSQQYKD